MSRIEELERRLARDPNSKVFAQLAEEYRKAGRLEEAIQACRKGLEHHSSYFSARVALGRALLDSSAFEEASREFETVLAQVPDNILANKFLAQTYEELGRLDDALAKYRVAQMLAPEDAELAKRIEMLETAVKRGPAPAPPEPAPFAEEVLEKAPPPLVVPDASAFEPEREISEPTLIEDQAAVPPPPPPPPEPAGEPFFELEEPAETAKPPRTFVRRQAAEIADSTPVSEEAQAIQAELEGRSPTGVIKRQKREILDSIQPATPPAPPVGPEEGARARVPEVGPAEPAPFPPVQPGPLPGPTADKPAGEPQKAGVPTVTLAELYASQGHLEQALTVYRQLLASQPEDPKIRQRLEDLTLLVRAQSEGGHAPGAHPESSSGDQIRAVRETIEVLEGWLAEIRRS